MSFEISRFYAVFGCAGPVEKEGLFQVRRRIKFVERFLMFNGATV